MHSTQRQEAREEKDLQNHLTQKIFLDKGLRIRNVKLFVLCMITQEDGSGIKTRIQVTSSSDAIAQY